MAILTAVPAMACSDLPNICEQQQQAWQQNVEHARQAAEAQANADSGAAAAPPAPPRDPTQMRIGAMTGMLQAVGGTLEQLHRYASDPKYKPIIDGKWDVYQDNAKARPGEYCAALFINAAGMLRVSGPGGDYKGALLTFWGPGIPKPDKVQTIAVALTQSDDNKPQTVKAFNYTERGELDYGAIALAVPSFDALLDGMIERLTFKLEVEGSKVLEMGWHSGVATRDKLRECAGKLGR